MEGADVRFQRAFAGGDLPGQVDQDEENADPEKDQNAERNNRLPDDPHEIVSGPLQISSCLANARGAG